MPNLIYSDAGAIALRFNLPLAQTSSSTMFVFSLRENNDAMHLVRQPDGRYVFEIIDAAQPYYYGASYELELGYFDDIATKFAVSWDSDGYEVYVNGHFVGRIAGHVDWTDDYDLVIGSRHDLAHPFAGTIDLVQVYDETLGAGEISALQTAINGIGGPFDSPAGFVTRDTTYEYEESTGGIGGSWIGVEPIGGAIVKKYWITTSQSSTWNIRIDVGDSVAS